jgi:hypothetical protein
MSRAKDVFEHPIEHHEPREGYDRTEPNAAAIWGFTIGSVVTLVLVIVAVQVYFESIYKEAVYERVLTAPSVQLQELRNRDAWNLSHYMYGDLSKSSGRVRVPIDQAIQTFANEAAAGKLFYPAKPTVPKKEEPEAPAAPATGVAVAPPAAPGSK